MFILCTLCTKITDAEILAALRDLGIIKAKQYYVRGYNGHVFGRLYGIGASIGWSCNKAMVPLT